MLTPKKQKYRKSMRLRGSLKGKANKGNFVAFGKFGLKSLGICEINSRQIEASRRAISRSIKRGGKLWIRIFPHKPLTKKAAETPMGSGKGAVEEYVAIVKPGTIIFELDGIEEIKAKEAFKLASYKLPVKTRFVSTNIA